MSWHDERTAQLTYGSTDRQAYSTVDRVRGRIPRRPSDLQLSAHLFFSRCTTLPPQRGDLHCEEELSIESMNAIFLPPFITHPLFFSQMDTISPEYFYDYLLRYPRVALHYHNWFSKCKPIPPTTGSSIDTKVWSLTMMVRGSTMIEQTDEA